MNLCHGVRELCEGGEGGRLAAAIVVENEEGGQAGGQVPSGCLAGLRAGLVQVPRCRCKPAGLCQDCYVGHVQGTHFL